MTNTTSPAGCLPTGRAFAAAILLGAPVLWTGPVVADGVARFAVRQEVINPGLEPFAATTLHMGAGARFFRGRGAFEPSVIRQRLDVVADAPDRIVAAPDAVSAWDTWRDGALDGAEAHVYRIENGAFRLVRRDRVAEGGHHASGWGEETPRGRMLPADRTTMTYVFPGWFRGDAEYWFSVRAVGRDGGLSAPAPAAAVRSPPVSTEKPEKPDLLPRPAPRRGEAVAPLAAPRRFAATPRRDGRVALSWEPVPGAIGYVLLRSDLPPERHEGYFLELEGGATGAPIRAGDLVYVSKTIYRPVRAELLTNRQWGANQSIRTYGERLLPVWPEEDPARRWRYAPHASETPVEEPGETYLELTLAAGARIEVGDFAYAGLAQDWHEVLEPGVRYRAEVWLRADRPSRAAFRAPGPLQNEIRPPVFDIDTQWRRYAFEFTPRTLLQERRSGKFVIELAGEGVFGVDNFRIHRADEAFYDLSAEQYARLARARTPMLRTHSFIKTGRRTYDLQQFTNPGGVASHMYANTLPQTLGIFERAGVDPWLQIEPHFSPEEWLGLLEYLAAPFDPARDDPAERPWAAKRFAQGRAAPWTDAFDRILLEIGNETWLYLFEPWIFPAMTDAATGRRYGPGAVLGLYTEFVLETLRSSPYWRAAGLDDKVEIALGGWQAQPHVGADAAAHAPNADWLTVGAYNAGWDVGEGAPSGTPEDFFNLLNGVSQFNLPRARAQAVALAKALRGRDGRASRMGTYEAGPGYAVNGLDGASVSREEARVQERVMRSQASGVATLDSFLALAAEGYAIQNFFAFDEGPLFRSHADWHRGGAPFPQWQLLGLFNREGPGDMLRVDTIAVPRADLPPKRRADAVEDAPLIAAYATRQADRLNLFVISRRAKGFPDPRSDGTTRVSVALPIADAGRLVHHAMAGPYEAHNADGLQVTIRTSERLVPPLADGAFVVESLPPGSAMLYVFEDVLWRE